MRAKPGDLPKPSIKDSRVLTYLNVVNEDPYVNTQEEDELVQLWNIKYLIAKAEYESTRVNSENVTYWRNAYLGIFNILDEQGNPTNTKIKALRKMAFEMVEQKINPRIPAPKMTPRYYSDIVPVEATEALLRYEIDKMLSEETQDESEHSTLIDSTSWLKVTWDPFESTHERSGMPVVESCPIDTVFPQPGIANYKLLEYIFERKLVTLATIIDLFGRVVKAVDDTDLVPIVEVYYLNQDRHVGRFVYVESDLTVLANDLEWGMRRRRECVSCNAVVNIEAKCPICGSEEFHYVGVKSYRLEQDLEKITNPYRSGDSSDPEEDETTANVDDTIKAGTEIPFYMIRQLPFIPKRHIKVPKDLYGISEVAIVLEQQDSANKLLNKAERKSEASKAWVTKLKDTRIDEENRELVYIEVESAQEGQAIQVKQVTADITEEVNMAQIFYEQAKSTVGVTDTDQGKHDPSARSGKAKQLQLAASQARQAAPTLQRNIAYAGVYELIFKYLLAFSDEERSFVKVMPDGSSREEAWSKYMFLDRDKNGNFYYRDDFAWSIDEATEITQDRAAMWQLIDNDFLNGTMGSEIDPVRALRMYWHMKQSVGYPTAKFAIAFLDDAVKHLPTQIEQALVNNPEAVQLALSYIQDMQGGGGQGGARDGAGKPNNQQSKGQQQEQANNASRAAEGQQTNTAAEATGGAQGGTGNDTNKE